MVVSPHRRHSASKYQGVLHHGDTYLHTQDVLVRRACTWKARGLPGWGRELTMSHFITRPGEQAYAGTGHQTDLTRDGS